MKNVHICRVCLRTDRTIQASDEVLLSLFDEFCDYEVNITYARFCSECTYILAKFKDFKEKCCLATKILQNWMKEDEAIRVPITSLSAKMPPPMLNFSSKKNFKVYFYQAFQLDTAATFEIPSSKYPHIVSVNIPPDDSISKTIKVQSSDDITELGKQTIKVKEEVEESVDNTDKLSTFVEVNIVNLIDTDYNYSEKDVFSKSNDDDIKNMDDIMNDGEVQSDVDVFSTKVAHTKKGTRKRKQLADVLSESDDDFENVDDIMNDRDVETDDSSEVNANILTKITQTKQVTRKRKQLADVLSESDDDFENLDDIMNDRDVETDDSSEVNASILTKITQTKQVTRKRNELANVFSKSDIPKKVAQTKKVPRKRKMFLKSDSEQDSDVNDDADFVPKSKRSEKISMEELKLRLVMRFSKCGVLKDEDGSVINTEIILNNLENMSLEVLRQLKNQVASGYGPQILEHDSIKLLALLQQQYSNNSNTNTEQHLNSPKTNSDTTGDILNIDKLIEDIMNDDIDSSDDEAIAKKIAEIKYVSSKKISDQMQNQKAKLERDKVTDVSTEDKTQRSAKRCKRKMSIDELKEKLVQVFGNFGELKDDEGSVIDTDVILKNLEHMPLATLRRLKNQFARRIGQKVISPDGQRLLSMLNKRYSNEYSNEFTVQYLPTEERMVDEFAKRQYYEHYTTAIHKCEKCYTPFRYSKEFANHVENCHNEKHQFVCSLCSWTFNQETSLRRHYFGHKTVFKCKKCPFVTNTKSVMIIHRDQHKGVIYTCKVCSSEFKSKSGLYMHVHTAHREKNDFTCKICGNKFSTACGLNIHQYKKHKGQNLDEPGERHEEMSRKNKLFCPLCNKGERGVRALKRHFETQHSEENFETHCAAVISDMQKYLCHICGKGFRSSFALVEHKHSHSGSRPYTCASCGATFARKGTLCTHLERHMPRNKQCNICGKRFTREKLLANHMSYHKPPTKECRICGKKFATSSNLACHMRCHTQTKKSYECSFCEKIFRSASNLAAHRRIHIGDRRYKCEICCKSFLHAGSLNEHVRGVHNQIRRKKKTTTET